MTGEINLEKLMAGMVPESRATDGGLVMADALPARLSPFADVAEGDGLTLIAPMVQLAAGGPSPVGPLAKITLTVRSALAAAGLPAAFATVMAKGGIIAHIITGLHHDQTLLPAADAHRAMALLRRLPHA